MATCPPVNGANLLHWFNSSVTFVEWVFFHRSGQNRPQIFTNCGLIPRRFHFPHRAWSQPSNLDSLDPTPNTCFARLTCSTFSALSMKFLSLLYLPRIDLWVGLLGFHPKLLSVWGRPDQYCWFPEHGSYLCPLAFFSFFPRFSSSPCDWVLGASQFLACSPRH